MKNSQSSTNISLLLLHNANRKSYIGPNLYKSSAVAEMGDCTREKWAEKWGRLLCPFTLGKLGPHLTQCRLGRGLPPYQVASWFIQQFNHNTLTLQDRHTHRHQFTPILIFTITLLILSQFLWSPYVIGQTIIFLPCDFYLSSSSFFPRLISAAVDWMSTILPHMVWP